MTEYLDPYKLSQERMRSLLDLIQTTSDLAAFEPLPDDHALRLTDNDGDELSPYSLGGVSLNIPIGRAPDRLDRALESGRRHINEALAALGGITLNLNDDETGERDRVTLIEWQGISPAGPDVHIWKTAGDPPRARPLPSSLIETLLNSLDQH